MINLQFCFLIYVYLFIYHRSLNDAVSNSDYTASNGKIISEKLNGKDVQGSGYGVF
jgi:hypothetical protein